VTTKPLSPMPFWRSLYMAALFETNRNQLPIRIREAEKALIIRERELFEIESSSSERQAVNSALNALRALRNCHGFE
jgi:hypothetical protein